MNFLRFIPLIFWLKLSRVRFVLYYKFAEKKKRAHKSVLFLVTRTRIDRLLRILMARRPKAEAFGTRLTAFC